MLKDITIGQYFPANSVVHKTDPRVKLLLLILLLVDLLFFSQNYITLFMSSAFILLVLIVSKIPLKMYFKNLKAILPVMIFTAIINMFYVKDGYVLLDWWIFNITTEGILKAVFMAVRVCMLILISATLTYTVTPNDLTEALERVLSPLKYVKLGSAVHIITMMMTIALRFIPILIEETQKIMNAQRSRGADFENGSLIQRIKGLVPILIPLFIMSVRRSYDLAEAMECRCYNGGEGRQRMKKMTLKTLDFWVIFITLLFSASVITVNFILR